MTATTTKPSAGPASGGSRTIDAAQRAAGDAKPRFPVLPPFTGHHLRTHRKLLGMTQKELGKALGMNHEHIGSMERDAVTIHKRTELAVRYLVLVKGLMDGGVSPTERSEPAEHKQSKQPNSLI